MFSLEVVRCQATATKEMQYLNAKGSFFFHAEDGIRDVAVTGVQTCALPISNSCITSVKVKMMTVRMPASDSGSTTRTIAPRRLQPSTRSEERRVGKEWRSRWSVQR